MDKILVQIFYPTPPWEGGIKNEVIEKLVGGLKLQNMNFRTHTNKTKSKIWALYLKHWGSYRIFHFFATKNNGEGNKKMSVICKYFLQGRCRFGNHCFNQHSSLPQCKFRSRCVAWPTCKFSHFEVCESYQDCKNQRCPLEHPQKPFLAKTKATLPPDLNCQATFPYLPRMKEMF